MWQNFVQWWEQPLKTQASASTWFLFVGFILIIIFLWTRILNEAGHIIAEA
jgi:hypothetical protein